MNKYITYSWKFYTYSKKASCKCCKCGKTITTTFSESYREDSSPDVSYIREQIEKWKQEKHICNKCKIEAIKCKQKDTTKTFVKEFKQIQDLQQQVTDLNQQINKCLSFLNDKLKGNIIKYKDNEYIIQYFDMGFIKPRIVASPINKKEPWHEKDSYKDWVYIDLKDEYIITDEVFKDRYKKIQEMEE